MAFAAILWMASGIYFPSLYDLVIEHIGYELGEIISP